MESTTSKVWNIYEGLRNKFLFNNDFNSIYILLTLYDLEENISNIYPRYFTTKKIRMRIKNILKTIKNRNTIANNISFLLHDDVNRIELCFYLEGYKYGYSNNKWVNILEEKALKIYGIEGIYRNKYLFHYDCIYKEIKEIKSLFRKEIDRKERMERYIEELVYAFSNRVIKKKLNNIDKYINKQLKIDFELYNFCISEESCELKEEELDKLYHGIVDILIKNLKEIYKNAAWYALNDKVLKRYF